MNVMLHSLWRIAGVFFSLAVVGDVHCASLARPLKSEEAKQILFMWQVPHDATTDEMRLMSQAGVNVIHHFNVSDWSSQQLSEYLDRATANRMKVVLYLGTLLEHRGCNWSLSPKAIDFVNKWKAHPAVFAWHTFDEPIANDRCAPKEMQKKIYSELKRVDPATPVMVSLNLTSLQEWENYFSEQAFDLLEIHAYVDGGIKKRQKALLKLFRNYRTRHDYPIVITLRAFNGWQGRADLGKSDLMLQYDFFIRNSRLTDSVGFYGWKLGMYAGISQDEGVFHQFLETAKVHSSRMYKKYGGKKLQERP